MRVGGQTLKNAFISGLVATNIILNTIKLCFKRLIEFDVNSKLTQNKQKPRNNLLKECCKCIIKALIVLRYKNTSAMAPGVGAMFRTVAQAHGTALLHKRNAIKSVHSMRTVVNVPLYFYFCFKFRNRLIALIVDFFFLEKIFT